MGIGAVSSSCDAIKEIAGGEVVCEYGCPTMEYQIKGKVVDSSNGNGIEGIRLSAFDIAGDEYQKDDPGVTLTGRNGEFVVSGQEFPAEELTVFASDIDGEDNGSFEAVSQSVKLTRIGNGDGKWFSGTYEASGVVVKMNPVSKQ